MHDQVQVLPQFFLVLIHRLCTAAFLELSGSDWVERDKLLDEVGHEIFMHILGEAGIFTHEVLLDRTLKQALDLIGRRLESILRHGSKLIKRIFEPFMIIAKVGNLIVKLVVHILDVAFDLRKSSHHRDTLQWCELAVGGWFLLVISLWTTCID